MKTFNRRCAGVCIIALAVMFGDAVVDAQTNRISGRGRYERIKGNPAMGYRELYEVNLFLTPSDTDQVMGRSRRLGTWNVSGNTCANILSHDGAYCINNMQAVAGNFVSIPDGLYSILVYEGLFYVTPKVQTDVIIQGGQAVTQHVELPIDYSTYFFDDWVGRTEAGDFRPASSPWYQTFVATGRSIRGVTCSFAGAAPNNLFLAVLEDNGDPNPVNWPVLGERFVMLIGSGPSDNWVRWRSGEIPTIPGRTYAIRIRGVGGPNNGGIQPYKRNHGPGSYPYGQAYNHDGVPSNENLNVTVFSDNDGTIVTMNKRTPEMGELKSPNYWGTRWGQTFTARGTSLAAVDFKASGINDVWELNFRWRVYPGADPAGITGPQIGPTRITNAAWNPSALHQAVSYNRDEVPLVPGQKYFIEFEVVDPPAQSPGFNPWIMDTDSYAGGHGYWWSGSGWVARPNDDVHMTIVEHQSPLISAAPLQLERTVYFGSTSAADSTFSVSNPGVDTINYSVSVDVPWLDVDPDSGSSVGATDEITVGYDAGLIAALSPGQHQGQITLTAPEAANSPVTVTVLLTHRSVPPDFDGDGDVDLDDFAHLQRCFRAAPQTDPLCQDAKLAGNDDVGSADLTLFLACFSGTDVPANPDCVP